MEEQKGELDELETLIAWRLPKEAGKYDGKLPLKCLSCNKIGHFSSRCPERMSRYDRHEKFDTHDRFDKKDIYEKNDKNDNPYKPYHKYKNQKRCYNAINEGVIDEESDNGNLGDEFVFIAIKEDDMIPVNTTRCIVEEKALATNIEERDE